MINNLLCAIRAAANASDIVKEIYFNTFSRLDIQYKSDNSPVTIADKSSNDYIINALKQTGIAVISEEGPHIDYENRKNEKLLWMIDPLDGTREFLNRSAEFTVNIALLENNYPTIGVICVPITSMLYFSMKDFGSYMIKIEDIKAVETIEQLVGISVKLPIENRSARENYIIAASSSFRDVKTDAFIEEKLKKEQNSIVKQIGSSLKFTLIAQGSIDLYPRFSPISEWDIAAGVIIAEEAGVKVYNANTLTKLNFNTKELKTEDFILSLNRML